jgi:NADP-dependent aldehyde dehydrogenase
MAVQRVLVTGAAGNLGTLMRPRLRRSGRVLRLMDRNPVPPPEEGEPVEIVTGSVTDPDLMAEVCRDVDVILHLGGISREDAWEPILDVNVTGTRVVLDAAVAAGVDRVVLASSNHAVGFRAIGDAGADGIPAEASPRPDTYYGVSKVAMEALGSLYHSRFGIDVICVRIGMCFPRPFDRRSLSLWLSPDDAGRLFEACFTAPAPGYRVIWGVSDNTRRRISLREAEALGYRSADDAEKFAADIPDATSVTGGPEYLGGPWVTDALGKPNPLMNLRSVLPGTQ